MTDQEKTTILKSIFNIRKQFPQLDGNENNKYTELEFFTSNQQSVEPFFNKINKTQTTIGKLKLQEIILNPLTNYKILNQRKNLLGKLNKNKILEEICDKIKSIKCFESDVLWFFRQSMKK